jgi:hypothetical protein
VADVVAGVSGLEPDDVEPAARFVALLQADTVTPAVAVITMMETSGRSHESRRRVKCTPTLLKTSKGSADQRAGSRDRAHRMVAGGMAEVALERQSWSAWPSGR